MEHIERYTPEISGKIRYEHLHRYAFAAEYAPNAVVLDIACGQGYGSAMLSKMAAKVVGVDIDPRAIANAADLYGHLPRLSYMEGSVFDIPCPEKTFDLVVCFETIEHVLDHQKMLSELKRVMKPGGLLIISSPERQAYNMFRSEANPHHVHELSMPEFSHLLKDSFSNVRLFGQRMIIASAIGRTAIEDQKPLEHQYHAYSGKALKNEVPIIEAATQIIEAPEYLVALVSDDSIPGDISPDSIFSMSNDDIWSEHSRIMHWASGLHEEHSAFVESSQKSDKELRRDLAEERRLRAASESVQRALEIVNLQHERYTSTLISARETVSIPPRMQKDGIPLSLNDEKIRQFKDNGLFIDAYYAASALSKGIPAADWNHFCNNLSDIDIPCNPLLSTSYVGSCVSGFSGVSAAYIMAAAPGLFDDVMHPLFDPGYYVSKNGVRLDPGESAIAHYMTHGRPQGWSTHPLIDTDWLYDRNPGSSPFDLIDYITRTDLFTLPIHPLFDPVHYLAKYPDVAAAAINPLAHYVAYGWRENRQPNRLFDNHWYIKQNPDVLSLNVSPLQHYAVVGQAELRAVHPLFDSHFYLDRYEDIRNLNYPPYKHFLNFGWSEGRLPTPAAADIIELLPHWPSSTFIDSISSRLIDVSILSASWPEPDSKFSWRKFGISFSLPRKMKDFIVDRFGIAHVDLYESLFGLLAKFEGYSTGVFSIDLPLEFTQDLSRLATGGASSNPRISIIIPVHNNLIYTLTCIYSLLADESDFPFEIVVANDASSDGTHDVVASIGGCVRLVDQERNVGFLENCNLAAATCQSDYIVFLNNDTLVLPGWLNELIGAMASNPRVGLVGSKLINADGSLQEAGGIIWRDGSAWNFGRGQDPNRPEFNYAKEVDYISGASIALPSHVWKRLHGFDPLFSPAYCEDSDLAFRVRSAKYLVRYQPSSMVIHHEGRSHGIDINSGVKSYQIQNMKKMYDRWRSELEEFHEENGKNVFIARDRSRSKPHIVVIDHYVPQWDKDAGSRSTYGYILFLVKNGFSVTFWPDNLYENRAYSKVLQNLGVEVIYSPAYRNGFGDWLAENAKHLDYVFFNRPHITEDYIDEFAKYGHIKKIYYGHDLHFKRLELEHALSGDPNALEEARRWEASERAIFSKCDAVLYPNFEETEFVREISPSTSAITIPVTIFQSSDLDVASSRIAYQDELNSFKLLFVGGFLHRPNVDGILWFAREVMPLLLESSDRFHLSIAGSNPLPEIYALANSHVDVLGSVSDEDLAKLYKTAGLAVVPLRFGAGVKGKVIEAMAKGVPVVTTNIGAQGILHADSIAFIGNSAEEFASAVIKAASDPNHSRLRARSALNYIRSFYTEVTVRKLLSAFMPELLVD